MFRSRDYAAACLATTALLTVTAVHAAEARRPADIEQVVITASPFSSNPDDIATIVGQVNRAEIVRGGGSSLADVLNQVPGVTGSGFAAGASRPVIRGFDANRVRILENGVGSFDVSDAGPDHGVPIDPLSIQKIEVVRGASTLRFGSQAIGGVVNAINNRIPLELPDRDFSGEASASYGTGANSRQGSLLADAKAGNFAFHADGFARRTGDYDIPGGTQPNSFFRGSGASLGSSYFAGDSRIGAAAVHYESKYGIPGGDTFIEMRQTKGMFGSSIALDAGALTTLNIDGGYADYKHIEKDDLGEVHSTFIDKEWDSRAEALFSAVGPFSAAALGAQMQHKDFSALGEGGNYMLPSTTKSVAGFGFAEMPLMSNLRLQTGVRVERTNVEGTPVSNVETSRSFTPVSGSVGLVLDATSAAKLGLTLSSAARAPAHTELFARGPHDGPAAYETGDPTLRMERANSLEGTLRYTSSAFEFEGALWGAKFNNYIYGRLTGNTCDEDGVCIPGDSEELKELLFEQRDATFWGIEGKATATLMRSSRGFVAGTVSADYVRAKLDGAGNVPRLPPFHVGAGLAWNSTPFDVGFQIKYAGAQNKTAFAETPTKGYVSVDAEAAWRPLASKPNLELAVVGRNLTDRIQRNAVSLNKDDIILPGRDIRLVVRAAF